MNPRRRLIPWQNLKKRRAREGDWQIIAGVDVAPSFVGIDYSREQSHTAHMQYENAKSTNLTISLCDLLPLPHSCIFENNKFSLSCLRRGVCERLQRAKPPKLLFVIFMMHCYRHSRVCFQLSVRVAE